MSEHFIKNIEIKNFKCFEDFKAEGFGRVNLIGGKNNVGKTTLLEAMYINLNSDNKIWFLNAIVKVIRGRDNFFISNTAENIVKFIKTAFLYNATLIEEYKKNKINFIKTNDNIINFNFIDHFTGTIIEYKINENNESENLSLNALKEVFLTEENLTSENKHLLRSIGLSNSKINIYYKYIQELDKENELNEYLHIFDKDIIKLKIMNTEPLIQNKNKNYISLTQLGEGLKQFINIFILLYSSKDGQILLDEIDNGIHYTNLDKLWEIILTISKQQNVQVFATTHSKECIESYARVAKSLEDEEIAFIKLGKNKENEIKAMVYPYEWFIDSIEQEEEVRGW